MYLFDTKPFTRDVAGLYGPRFSSPFLPPIPGERTPAAGRTDRAPHPVGTWEADWIDLGGEG